MSKLTAATDALVLAFEDDKRRLSAARHITAALESGLSSAEIASATAESRARHALGDDFTPESVKDRLFSVSRATVSFYAAALKALVTLGVDESPVMFGHAFRLVTRGGGQKALDMIAPAYTELTKDEATERFPKDVAAALTGAFKTPVVEAAPDADESDASEAEALTPVTDARPDYATIVATLDYWATLEWSADERERVSAALIATGNLFAPVLV